jgi:regulator of replication initiation timing
MRDTKPLLIVLLSIGLVGTWAYHLYDKTQYSSRKTEVFVKDSAAIADAVRDSLMMRYNDTIRKMDSRLSSAETGSDSLKNQLDNTFSQMNSLKGQINAILKKGSATKTDLAQARNMISALQSKVDDLSGANNSIAEEKDRLNGQMQQLTVQINDLQQNIHNLSDENVKLADEIKQASLFVASQISLLAVNAKGGNKEEETDLAKKADKFVASFTVQNLTYEYTPAEVIIIVIEPDGNVLQNSDWGPDNFETKSQGIRAFTRRVKFDYIKGQQKQVIFSLHADKFEPGTYKFQLWHKGVMIGQSSTTLG